jgi:hypothetical protein
LPFNSPSFVLSLNSFPFKTDRTWPIYLTMVC